MPITITNNYTPPNVNLLQSYHNSYKKNVEEKAVVSNPHKTEAIKEENFTQNKLQEFLSVDEKRVLKEVFGDLNVDRNVYNPYNGTKFAYIFKGSQLDIRL
jgi:hypothetical protein